MRMRLRVTAEIGVTCALLMAFSVRAQDAAGAVQSGTGQGTRTGAASAGTQEGGGPRGHYSGMGRVAGEVTAVNGAVLTIRGEDGKTSQIVTTDNTRLMKDRGPVRLTDLHPGDGVMAVGNLEERTHTLHAAMVFAEDAEQVKAMRENLGKSYITGRVKSVDLDNARLTVERGDGKTQVIGLDDTTSFRRAVRGNRGSGGEGGSGSGGEGQGRGGPGGGGVGAGGGMGMRGMGAGLMEAMDRAFSHGESITLADIKAGDAVSGTGGLKNGLFVPTRLLDVPAGMRRGRPEGAAPSGPAEATPAGSSGVAAGVGPSR